MSKDASENPRDSETITKVNLASGKRCQAEWINIDNSLNARLARHTTLYRLLHAVRLVPEEYYDWHDVIRHVVVHDIRKGLPFDDATVDFIYSSHFIEHLSREECVSVLEECYRVLKKGGVIRLVTPDLEKLAQCYVDRVHSEKNAEASEMFLRILLNLDDGSPKPFHVKYVLDRFHAKHKYAYDQYSLAVLLMRCGFVNVQKKAFQVGRVPDIQFLDWKPEESLHVEAEKPMP